MVHHQSNTWSGFWDLNKTPLMNRSPRNTFLYPFHLRRNAIRDEEVIEEQVKIIWIDMYT